MPPTRSSSNAAGPPSTLRPPRTLNASPAGHTQPVPCARLDQPAINPNNLEIPAPTIMTERELLRLSKPDQSAGNEDLLLLNLLNRILSW